MIHHIDYDYQMSLMHCVNPLYFQLCETLKRDCSKVHIAAIEIANEGVCIRFAPMESIHGK